MGSLCLQPARPVRDCIGRTLGGIVCLAILVAVMPSDGHAAKNIFDDDWEPPRASTPTPAPAPGSATPATPPASPPTDAPATPPDAGPTPPAPIPEPQVVAPESGVPAEATARKPIPPAPDQKRSRSLLRETFTRQLKDHSVSGRRQLAQALIDAAANASAIPADQYVLLSGAVVAAQEAASLPLCTRAADLLAGGYEVNGLDLKATSALKMPLRADTPAHTVENVRAGLALLDELSAIENFAAAARLGAVLQPLAGTDRAMRTAVESRLKDAQAGRAAQERVASSLLKLKAAPDDPAVNLAVGRYFCFERNRWDEGLAMLVKGSDPALKAAAVAELAKPITPDAMTALGDQWWDVGEHTPDPARAPIRAHAVYWYRPAASTLTGLAKLQVDKRIGLVVGASASFRLIKAAYGCDDNAMTDVTEKIQAALSASPYVAVGSDNTLVGSDPGPYRPKVLRVRYALREGDTTGEEVYMGEGGLLILPPLPDDGVPAPGTGQAFTILAARYGVGLTWIDVTKAVQDRVPVPTRPFSFSSADAGSDPGDGMRKHLTVWFRYRGRQYVRAAEEYNGIHDFVLIK